MAWSGLCWEMTWPQSGHRGQEPGQGSPGLGHVVGREAGLDGQLTWRGPPAPHVGRLCSFVLSRGRPQGTWRVALWPGCPAFGSLPASRPRVPPSSARAGQLQSGHLGCPGPDGGQGVQDRRRGGAQGSVEGLGWEVGRVVEEEGCGPEPGHMRAVMRRHRVRHGPHPAIQ